jgi:magnesium-transporting ATPase (P-type)
MRSRVKKKIFLEIQEKREPELMSKTPIPKTGNNKPKRSIWYWIFVSFLLLTIFFLLYLIILK